MKTQNSMTQTFYNVYVSLIWQAIFEINHRKVEISLDLSSDSNTKYAWFILPVKSIFSMDK